MEQQYHATVNSVMQQPPQQQFKSGIGGVGGIGVGGSGVGGNAPHSSSSINHQANNSGMPVATAATSKSGNVAVVSAAAAAAAVSKHLPSHVQGLFRPDRGGGGGGGGGVSRSAEIKRCRFASKDSIQFEQVVDDDEFNPFMPTSAGTTSSSSDLKPTWPSGPSFVPPPRLSLPLDRAFHLLSLAADGRPLPPEWSDVERSPPRGLPSGNQRYLFRRKSKAVSNGGAGAAAAAAATALEDGHDWKNVFRVSDRVGGKVLSTALDVCRVSLSPRRTVELRRECYELEGGMTLVLYSEEGTPDVAAAAEEDAWEKQLLLHSDVVAKRQLQNNHQRSLNSKPVSAATATGAASTAATEVNFTQQFKASMLQLHPSPRPTSSCSTTAFPTSHDWIDENLVSVSEELASGKVVKNLTIFPSLQMTLVHPDMTKEFENCCKVFNESETLNSTSGAADFLDLSSSGIKLFYDTTFAFGKLYATVLTFVNGCYEGDPVMPLAVNLHEAKFKSSHQLFWARIVGDLPALQKYRFPLFIDDAEPAVHLAVRTQAPNLVQLEAWTHRFRDIDEHLRARGYGDEALHYYKACVSYLLNAGSKQAMHDRFRKEFESVWPKDFVFYYRQRLLPRSGRLGKWAMLKMKIRDELFLCPHTNPQMEFHSLCHNFSGWDSFNMEQLVRAFYFLFLFYVSETYESRSNAASGTTSSSASCYFTLKPQFQNMGRSKSGPHLRASYKYIPHPSEICKFILQNYPAKSFASTTRPGSAAATAAAAAAAVNIAQQQQQQPGQQQQQQQQHEQWMAYGAATEVFAGGGPAHQLPTKQHEMEGICDMRAELKDLIQQHQQGRSAKVMEQLGFSDLHLGGPAEGDELDDLCDEDELDSRMQFYSHPPPHSPHHAAAAVSIPGAPPSPAPNGNPLEVELGLRQKNHQLLDQHQQLSQPQQHHQSGSSSQLQSKGIAGGSGGGSGGGSSNGPAVFSSGLTTIPEVPSDSRASSVANVVNVLGGPGGGIGGIGGVSSYVMNSGGRGGQARGQQGDLQLEVGGVVGHNSYHVHGRHAADHSRPGASLHGGAGGVEDHFVHGSKNYVRGQEYNQPNSSGMTKALLPAQDKRQQQQHHHQQQQRQLLERGVPQPPSAAATTTSSSAPTPSMMLWKKVQHCVVFGGSFITAAKEREAARAAAAATGAATTTAAGAAAATTAATAATAQSANMNTTTSMHGRRSNNSAH